MTDISFQLVDLLRVSYLQAYVGLRFVLVTLLVTLCLMAWISGGLNEGD